MLRTGSGFWAGKGTGSFGCTPDADPLYYSLGSVSKLTGSGSKNQCLQLKKKSRVRLPSLIDMHKIRQNIPQGRPFSYVSKFVHNNHRLYLTLNNRRPIIVASLIPAGWLVDTLKRAGRALVASYVISKGQFDTNEQWRPYWILPATWSVRLAPWLDW